MKTNYPVILLAALIGCFFIHSCGSGKPEVIRVDPAFSEYISAYTSGMSTRTGNIRIQLEEDVATRCPECLPDSALLEDLFSFEPEIAGHAEWIDNHTVEFVPDTVLPVNQFYDVHFDLEKLKQVKSGFEDFHFQFATYPQDLFVTVDGLYDNDSYDLRWKQLRGTIKTTDFEDTALLRQTLKITQDGKELPFTLEPSYEENQFFFQSALVERKETAGQVLVTWNGQPIRSGKKGKETVDVPALGDFSITEAKVVDREDQYVELQFSEPISTGQDLNGIVSIEGIDRLTYTISYNSVMVYLPNRFVGTRKLTVTDGIKNAMGHHMLKPFSQDLIFEDPKPLVRIKGNGSILPNSNGLIFPFEAISLKAVDVRIIKIFENNIHHFLQVNNLDGDDGLTRFGKIIVEKKIALDYDKTMNLKQWNSHVLDLNKLIKADPGAIYRVSIRFRKEYAVCDCPVTEEEPGTVDESAGSYETYDPDWSEEHWDGYGFDGGYDSWDNYSDDYNACNDYYYEGKGVSRNILASDLGVIFKLDEARLSHAFVSDMITTEPVANAEVQYFDFTKQLIASGTTNAEGMLDIQLKQKPFLMITKRGSQRGYLKLGDGYANSLSEFDIEGEVVQNGVKGYIYGERGVWRPGDSLYLTFILQDLWKKLPENHPVKFELQDPNGQVVYETTKTKHLNSMYDFRTATSSAAPTGNYTAMVRVGNRTFTKNLRVETVKPNRLKIYMDVGTGIAKDSTKLVVKWLHGAVAKFLRATVTVKVSELGTSFPSYKSYVFDSPLRSCNSDMETVFDQNLDQNGMAMVKTRLNIGSEVPGMLRAHYITRVYEVGGDFSIDRTSVNYSPFETYVGLHVPESGTFDGSLETDRTHRFDIVTVNENGRPVTTEKLQVKIYKLQWRWWYETDDEDLTDYMARTGTIVIKDTTLSAKGGKAALNFRIPSPDYGRYLVTVTDEAGKHQTGTIVTVDYPYMSRSNHRDNEHANMLNFSSDKTDYTKGETIKLSFPSPSDGRALVSVETSRKVVKKCWIRTTKGETTYEFPATADMSPNAYVHVTLIQPHASTKNDLPIRMYGVIPITVDDPATHVHPEIAMVDAVRPESFTTIRVNEQNGRKMTYTLELVDEGLLDLTAFKTPQPWTTFYAREALGVRTWDIYDHVIGAYAGKLDKLLSIGGDGDLDGSKGPKANRFKPMVVHLGPFELEAGQSGSHKVPIPNYVGSVRVMVVAHNEGAYGSAEKTVAVKKPLMLLATLPRVLGPGEQVEMPVNIFAMEKHVKDVKVTVEVNDLLTISGSKQQQITFSQPGDEVLNFRLDVAGRIGIAKVKITAVSGNEQSVQEIELYVRTPNPTVFEGKEVVLEPGKEWNTELAFKGITGTNQATVEFSSIPSIGLEKRLDYLIEYPHGCIEQTTSAAFPQLYVDNLMDLDAKRQERTSANIKAGLKRLQLFQTSAGGFSYWPGENDESEWGTNYAGHFLLEAEQQGYSLPGNLKERWVNYQQQMARNWSGTGEIIQAYRLFVLALSKHPELGAMNRLREMKNLPAAAKWRLAATYQLVGQQEAARKLSEDLPVTVAAYKELSYSYGSDVRDQAMILETLSLLNSKSKATTLAKDLAAKLSSDKWMSTQETAYSLLAMCEYAGVKTNASGMSFSCKLNGTIQKATSKKSICQVAYTENDFRKKAGLYCKNTGSTTLFVKVIVQGTPLTGDKSSASSNLKIDLKFFDRDGQRIQPDELKQGTDFFAEVTITNPGKKGVYKEMALTQIFPSGWEIHNARMDEDGTTSPARYQDIRDDRVYSYYELAPNTSKTFKIQLNATYLGRFYLPTTYTEAMYDHLINARVPGKWVKVVREQPV